MTTESFDDKVLIELTKSTYYGHKTGFARTDIEECFDKEKLTMGERNRLVNFVNMHKYTKPLSMTEMKRQIMAHIGVEPNSSYSNTVSRADLEAIYQYIVRGK